MLTPLAVAQQPAPLDQDTLLLLTDPLELRLIDNPNAIPTDGSIVTATTISQTELTIPSLWWANQQFGDKLVDNWLAYSGNTGVLRRVDLIVNPQVWSLYTYLERYAFITQFGSSVKDFGYNTRFFSRQQGLLGAYICNFGDVGIEPASSSAETLSVAYAQDELGELQCNIFLDPFGSGALRGRSNPFGALQPTGGGTD
ncbi:hypothetical protein IQ268_02550 [Oculatella sp. LEGE 06141]|uniref:hypothetical protein n=1 Tax=Oculatella sp. LEGE 06141 TaxID=1828648 RepID=UPI00188084C4|nr:hypothetical protein [Oculatella sp. LEGE 06141]MBE9177455.1 hypothetical protein [Oculatella sp. LEGE 06141]